MLAAIVAGALIYLSVLVHERNAARSEVRRDSAQIVDLQSSNQQFQAAVGQCNAQVTRLRSAAGALAREQQARENSFNQRANAIVAASATQAAILQTAKIAPDCENAIRWGRAEGPELGRW